MTVEEAVEVILKGDAWVRCELCNGTRGSFIGAGGGTGGSGRSFGFGSNGISIGMGGGGSAGGSGIGGSSSSLGGRASVGGTMSSFQSCKRCRGYGLILQDHIKEACQILGKELPIPPTHRLHDGEAHDP